MQPLSGFDFYSLNFDDKGKLTEGNEFAAFQQAAGAATDVILIAHGFRNNLADAMEVYSGFFQTFRGHLTRPEFQEISRRRFVLGGVFWPSKSLPEDFAFGSDGGAQSADPDTSLAIMATQKLAELKQTVPQRAAELDQAAALVPMLEGDPSAQDKFTALVMSVMDGSELDASEGLPLIRQQKGSEMLPKLIAPVILPTVKPGDMDTVDSGAFNSFDGGGVESISSVFGSVLGGVDKFLNLTTWYVMKNRSGVVGATGVAQAVRDVGAAHPGTRIHLVGHSLGGRLMAACAKALAQSPLLQPDSVMLLEAAFSHYGFSADNGHGAAGFFRDVISKQVVRGPLVETFSFQDTVVGTTYAIPSRLARDNAQAIGDADDEFGGIGRNGCQRTVESFFQPLKSAGTLQAPYIFKTGVVNCVDGSGGLIKNHGDVMNADVTYAFASAVASTRGAGALSVGV